MFHNPLINSNYIYIYMVTKPNPTVRILKQCLNTLKRLKMISWRFACNNKACFRNYYYTDNTKWLIIVKNRTSWFQMKSPIFDWFKHENSIYWFFIPSNTFVGDFFCNEAIKAIAVVLLLLFVWVYFAQLNDVLCFI